jgi:tetratricopeptide (TPR) repeat protein
MDSKKIRPSRVERLKKDFNHFLFWILPLCGSLNLALTSCAHVPSRNFTGLFYSQWDSRDPAGMEQTLKDWKTLGAPDPELPVAEGYLKWFQAFSGPQGTSPSTALPLLRYPHREEAFRPNQWNPQDLLDVEIAWHDTLQTQPDRLDVILELIRVEQTIGRFEAQYSLLARTLQRIDLQEGSFQWVPGRPMPDSPTRLLSAELLESQAFWFSRGPEGLDRASRLARLAMTFHEEDPLPYNALAVYHQAQNNPRHALKYLIYALHRDEGNCMVLGNIGRLLSSIGKRREARIYFKKVLKLDKDAFETMEARRYLGKRGG